MRQRPGGRSVVLASTELDDDAGLRSAEAYSPAALEAASRYRLAAGVALGAASPTKSPNGVEEETVAGLAFLAVQLCGQDKNRTVLVRGTSSSKKYI